MDVVGTSVSRIRHWMTGRINDIGNAVSGHRQYVVIGVDESDFSMDALVCLHTFASDAVRPECRTKGNFRQPCASQAPNIIAMEKVATEDAIETASRGYVINFHKVGNKVILLHCPENFVNATTMSPGRVIELQRDGQGKTAELKRKFIEKANQLEVEAEFVVENAEKPGHAIVDVATRYDAAFVVTGTRGMGKLRRTILGSVSDFVVHHAPCPVLVCRHKDK